MTVTHMAVCKSLTTWCQNSKLSEIVCQNPKQKVLSRHCLVKTGPSTFILFCRIRSTTVLAEHKVWYLGTGDSEQEYICLDSTCGSRPTCVMNVLFIVPYSKHFYIAGIFQQLSWQNMTSGSFGKKSCCSSHMRISANSMNTMNLAKKDTCINNVEL